MNEISWGDMLLGSMFSFERGRESNMASLSCGAIPLVSAKKVNNGIKAFVSSPAKVIRGGNVISLNNDGDGGAGLAFYQPFDFALDTHVTALHPKFPIPKDALLYMAAIISRQSDVFGHGRSISLPRLRRIRSMFPVGDDGKPDIAYMEEYARNLRAAMLARYTKYAERRLAELGELEDIPKLEDKEWASFRLTDVFDKIRRGKRLKKADHVEGATPYVSSTALMNGNDGTCGNSAGTRRFSDCLTIANSGSVGSCFYHPYEFVASDHVTMLEKAGASEPLYLALAALLARLGEKYNFNREINDKRISRERVMLPVDEKGEPDFGYLERYAKNLMIRKYRQYMEFARGR